MDTRDHVGAGRTGRAKTEPDIARRRPGVSLGHVGSALDVSRQDVADPTARLQRRIERVDRGAGNPEGADDAFLLKHTHCGIDSSRSGHDALRLPASDTA